ncbi:ABC transporter permease [Alkalibacillus haloalkaliphilus]|uniref:ABC transporter permease n=1 Tax=Alkalibacillus haloalkaliphilus TaxID=94136 RepID=UPI0029360445|nr:ABC transporter permease [Alkalibacillus haloalkaliphilus]MDV2582486.1 ABC transporter permease [Alkalibacillus haloalkaliphilus]
MILWKSILTKKTTLLILILMPIILLISISLFQQTADDFRVSVLVVDPYEQSEFSELMERIDEPEPFSVQINNDLDLQSLARGDVEAIFVVEDNFEKKVQNGNIDELFTWYRYDHSIVDGLFKEYIAATLMETVVRHEAARYVTDELDDINRQEVFDFGLRYFEPDPLFQMNFQSYGHGSQVDERPEVQHGQMLLFIWAYIWLLITYFTSFLDQYRETQLLNRLSVYTFGKVKLYRSWLMLIIVLISVLLSGVGLISSQMDIQLETNALMGLFLLCIISVLLLLILNLLLKNRKTFLALTIMYWIVSVVMFMFVDWQIVDEAWWVYFLIPVWLS